MLGHAQINVTDKPIVNWHPYELQIAVTLLFTPLLNKYVIRHTIQIVTEGWIDYISS